MTPQTTPYRWNTSAAAEAFDRAAEFIHPFYLPIQDKLLDLLAFDGGEPFLVVDLGAGSGRLIERVLERFARARGVLVDQSEPFLALAERRLQRFGDRTALIQKRLQDDWRVELPAKPQAIVSMSAIHHLDAAEKRALFRRCKEALTPGGIFINGDEFRPDSETEYLAQLEWWSEQKELAERAGRIPASFRPVFEAWYDRNVRRFGEPKHSGDDCHETAARQVSYLRDAGFAHVEIVWTKKLWAILLAS